MDFFLYLFEGGVAGVPLTLVFLQMKIFKLSPKAVACCLLPSLMVSVFFWLQIKNTHLIIRQSAAYVASYAWIIAEHVLIKRQKAADKIIDRGDETSNEGSNSRC